MYLHYAGKLSVRPIGLDSFNIDGAVIDPSEGRRSATMARSKFYPACSQRACWEQVSTSTVT
jgi:hypothetical protein